MKFFQKLILSQLKSSSFATFPRTPLRKILRTFHSFFSIHLEFSPHFVRRSIKASKKNPKINLKQTFQKQFYSPYSNEATIPCLLLIYSGWKANVCSVTVLFCHVESLKLLLNVVMLVAFDMKLKFPMKSSLALFVTPILFDHGNDFSEVGIGWKSSRS